MRLEIATYRAERVTFAGHTRLDDGILGVDRDALMRLALGDHDFPWASVDIVRPGESVRLINVTDMFEPMVKVTGSGMVYPGVCGRPGSRVGEGRTNTLGNVAVVLCVDEVGQGLKSLTPVAPPPGQGTAGPGSFRPFLDMSGPGRIPPYDSRTLVCLSVQPPADLDAEDRHVAIYSAALRVTDRLAETTVGLVPQQVETFDFNEPDRSLPGVIFLPHLASVEWQTPAGARSAIGPAVYGQTRLSAPWLLYPTEMMDGAVFGSYGRGRPATWHLSHNPIVMALARRHGQTMNFLGCVVQRTNWTSEAEKELMAERAALLARQLGASGAIVTTDYRGQRFLETALTVRACERAGIATVLLTEEEDNEEGNAPPLLVSFPEIRTVVSSGTGSISEPFPAVETVIGARSPAKEWYGDLPPVHGRYGVGYAPDYYGFGFRSQADVYMPARRPDDAPERSAVIPSKGA